MLSEGKNKSRLIFTTVTLLVLAFLPFQRALAAPVSNFSVTLSTIRESVVANHTLVFTINDQWDAGETLTIDYPDTFGTVGFATSDPLDFDITDDAAEKGVVAAGACVANSIEISAINTATDTFTFNSCPGSVAMTVGSVIAIEIGTHATFGGTGNTQIVNQTVANNNTDNLVSIGGTFAGTGSAAIEIVADDDVTILATVLSRITCEYSGLTSSFPAMDGTIQTATTATVITVTTNASNGFNLNVRGAGNGINPGLFKSTPTTHLIGSADNSFADTATLAANVDGYGLQGTTSGGTGGTVTIAARFNQTGNVVGGLELTDRLLASATSPVSNRAITINYRAAVSGLAPAGSYTDTLTYVCTGIF